VAQSPDPLSPIVVTAQYMNGNGGSLAFVGLPVVAAADTAIATIVVTAVSTAIGVLLPDSTSSSDTTDDSSGFAFHYTTNANRASIVASGFIRPGASGVAYVSPSPYSTAASAQSQLALPTTPDGYFVIPSQSLPGPLSWSVVAPNFGFPGGGFEGTTLLPIPIGGATWVPFSR
jgi:hypothetical protein